ncbi:glucose oxidase-like protein [Tricladium varicosporioides]|nr:glucose oxidase-like protein [Hymenoscyphus varicosporioides]
MAGIFSLFLTLSSHQVQPILATNPVLEFDYIVIGGGTAGLTVANRLSEIPTVSVAVIEAGSSVLNNPNVTNPDVFTVAIGTDIDWNYSTVNQTHANGRIMRQIAGKALGGTSTINGMTYIRAEKSQIDAWGKIGNEGWSWDELFPYYKKSENLTRPSQAQAASGATFNPINHGEDGPLKVGFPSMLANGTIFDIIAATWNGLGIPTSTDMNGGAVRGISVFPSTIDADAHLREDAARAYYYPFQERKNLHIFLQTTANRIAWHKTGGNKQVANGVEVTFSNATVRTLKAKREVIVSAGSLRSPAILELSGVGNPNILSKYGIGTIIRLPGVGENLQDQPNNACAYNSTFGLVNGSATYVAYGSDSDFLPSLPLRSQLLTWAQKVSGAINNAISPATLEYFFTIQYELLYSSVPNAEVIIAATKQYGLGVTSILFSAFWVLLPFSRGNVHITSADPMVQPAMNPNFFLLDYDLEVQVAIAKWTRKFWASEPIGKYVTELSPGFATVPANASDEVWGEYVKTNFGGNSHPVGTAAMMPEQLGGVVDARLKVYGTSNVRVVDASVFPFQVSGHLSSTIYAIAEKASDMIKEDMRLCA